MHGATIRSVGFLYILLTLLPGTKVFTFCSYASLSFIATVPSLSASATIILLASYESVLLLYVIVF